MEFAPSDQQFFLNGLSAQSPGSTESLILEGGPDPRTLMFQNSPDFESITGSIAEDPLDSFNMQRLSNNRTGASAGNSSSFNYSLAQFYRDQEEPWTGLSKSGGVGSGHQADLLYQLSAEPLFGRHDAIDQSECETIGHLASDSGYGSLPRKSVGAPSVFSEVDRSGDSQSISHALTGLHQRSFPQNTSTRNAPKPQSRVPSAGACKLGNELGEIGPSSLPCTICSKKLKTPSELKKHLARHTRPHKCKEPNCTRTEGFSTLNDLQRHKESVHNAGGVKYRCSLDQCAKKDKIWPRADNFRQHLKRVHKTEVRTEDLESYSVGTEVDLYRSVIPIQEVFHHKKEIINDDPLKTGSWIGIGPADEDEEMGRFQNSSALIDEQDFLVAGDDGYYRSQAQGMDPISTEPQFDQLLGLGTLHPELGPMCLSGHAMDGHLQQSPGPPFHGDDVEKRFPFAESMDMETESITGAGETSSPHDEDLNGEAISPLVHPQMSMEEVGPEVVAIGGNDGSEPNIVGSDADDDSMDLTSPGPSLVSDRSIPAIHSAHTMSDKAVESKLINSEDTNCTSDDVSSGDKGPSDDTLKALNQLILKSLKQGQLDGLLKELGYQKAHERANKLRKPLPAPNNQREENAVTCPECQKNFGRQCELKKHLKRHEKPYGCTFSNCNKHFGSKNDWKRHENGQHFHMEMWKCEEASKDHPEKTCPKVCNRREKFRDHLQRDHGIKAYEEVERKCAECRLGRNGEARFWCGFCEKTIDIKQKGCGAWAERFDHIELHYLDRGVFEKKERSQWKSIDPLLPDLGFPGISGTPPSYHMRDQSPPPSPPEMLEPVMMLPSQNPAKRARDDDDDYPQQKRLRTDGRMVQFWACCHCYCEWPTETTSSCKNDKCKVHIPCYNCRPFEKYVPIDKDVVVLDDD